MTRLTQFFSQGLLGAATVFACLAVWEWALEIFDLQLRFLRGYEPIHLVELAAVALLFVITLELRGIKHLSGAPKA